MSRKIKALYVNVSLSYPEGTFDSAALHDAAYKAWPVTIESAHDVDIVVPVRNGEVLATFEVKHVFEVHNEFFETRAGLRNRVGFVFVPGTPGVLARFIPNITAWPVVKIAYFEI